MPCRLSVDCTLSADVGSFWPMKSAGNGLFRGSEALAKHQAATELRPCVGRAERLLDLGRSLEHERHELAPSRGTDTGARPAEADARDETARAVANRRREGHEAILQLVDDLGPAAAPDTTSSAASPETVVTVRAVSRTGWACSNHASSSLWLSSARTSFPADEACSGMSAPTQPTTPRRCAPSSWVTISIAVRPVTMARSADSSARSRSRRSGPPAASISALWGSALRASRNSSLPITHPAGVSATSPRSANVRSVRLTVARGCPVERESADAEAGSADWATAERTSIARSSATVRGIPRLCSSDEQSRLSHDQVVASTDADRLRHPHRVRDDRRPDPVPRRADRRARAAVGHERARDADVPLEPPCGLDPPRPLRARGRARCELRLHVARHAAHASPRPLRRRRRHRRARRGRRVLGAPERAARGPALQRLQRLAAGQLASGPSLGCGG